MDPRGPFEKARKLAKLNWVGFHDLRRFRATQWVMQGVDLVAVKTLLGHKDIQTTMRYIHLSPNYIARVVVVAQRKETELMQEENRRTDFQGQDANEKNTRNSFVPLECERGDSNSYGLPH